MMVKTDGLRLRSAPSSLNDDNIITLMPLAQEVSVINSTAGERFWEVETIVDGEPLKGFAGSQYLRQPLSQTKEKLLAAAVREWITFNRGEGQEGDDPYYKRVGDYYVRLDIQNISGKNHDHYWSAAFISFIVREAGYADFKFSDGHWKYIRDAKTKRVANTANVSILAFQAK